MKKRAQNILEYTFAFIIVMAFFIALVDYSLYLRAKNCVQDIAEEIIANIQITGQNSTNKTDIINKAENVLKKRAALLNMENITLQTTSEGNFYTIKDSTGKLQAFVNIEDVKTNINAGVSYKYRGFFILQNGVIISSSAVQSIEKY